MASGDWPVRYRRTGPAGKHLPTDLQLAMDSLIDGVHEVAGGWLTLIVTNTPTEGERVTARWQVTPVLWTASTSCSSSDGRFVKHSETFYSIPRRNMPSRINNWYYCRKWLHGAIVSVWVVTVECGLLSWLKLPTHIHTDVHVVRSLHSSA